MKTMFLSSVAAVALALSLPALAQTSGQTGGSSGTAQPPAATQGGGAAGSSSPNRGTTQAPADAEGGMSAQGGADARGGTSACPPGAPDCGAGASGSTKAETDMKSRSDMKTQTDTKERSGSAQQDTKEDSGSAQKEMQEPGTRTTGESREKSGSQEPMREGAREERSSGSDMKQGRAAAAVELTSEKRTRIRERIETSKIERVNVDFDVSVGVAVPSTVVLHPIPTEIVTIVPEYRGYRYFVLADGRIVIVEPDSPEIVTIIAS